MSEIDERVYVEQARHSLEKLRERVVSEIEQHAATVKSDVKSRLEEVKRKLTAVFE